MSEILRIAIKELGVKEIQGEEDNPVILKYASESGFDWVDDDETPWCSIFVNWVAQKCGTVRSEAANARSWLDVGENTDQNPLPGDVVVFWRGSIDSWQGHVGIFLGYSKDPNSVFCLGGNQANSVNISKYSISKILGFRRLSKSEAIEIPEPSLSIGDKGDEVKKLQNVLNKVGFDCGRPDGHFGNNTKNAIIQLQTSIRSSEINGVYDQKSNDHLFELING